MGSIYSHNHITCIHVLPNCYLHDRSDGLCECFGPLEEAAEAQKVPSSILLSATDK